MSAFSKLVVLFAFALSATALTTPHAARGLHEHHALAARMAAPEPEPLAEVRVVKPKRLRRRGASGRCSSTASSTSSTLASSSTSSSSSVADIATAVVNVAGTAAPVDPTPTPTPEPTPTSSADPAPTSSAAPATGGGSIFGSFFAGTISGQGTFYSTGLGACGITNTDSDFIAAAAFGMFDSVPGYNGNPNQNPVCGKQVIASANGKSVTVAITDRCAGCDIAGSLDFSPAAFNQLADPSVGRIDITWQWA